MTYDLRTGLAALGREERDVAPDLPIDALTARAHRLRTTHAAQYSAIGVGAAAVLTFGAISADGLLLDRDPAPAPPATDEPGPTTDRTTPDRTTPSPTPTPTPSATPTEAAWQPSWDLCGMPAEDFYGLDTGWVEGTSQELYLSSDTPTDSALPLNTSLDLRLQVLSWGLPDEDVDVRITGVVGLETDPATGNGHVVAVAAGPVGATASGTLTEGDGLELEPGTAALTACTASPLTGGDGALDAALPDGAYTAAALAEVTTADGVETLVGWLGFLGALPEVPEALESEGLSTGPAPTWQYETLTVGTPLRLGPTATWNNSNLTADAQAPWCGAPALTTPPRNDPVPGMTLTGTGFRDGEELIVQMTLTNTWDRPVPWGSLNYPYVSVSSNGRIIGSAYAHLSAFDLPDQFQPGEGVQLEVSLGRFTCTFMQGEPWPAGTYELHAEVYLVTSPDVVPDIAGYGVRTTFTLD